MPDTPPPPPTPPQSPSAGGQSANAPQGQPAPLFAPQQISPVVLARLLAAVGARGAVPYAVAPGLTPGMPVMLPLPQSQQTLQVWQGQYPPPEAVEHYEKVLPGAFDRMIKMAEQLQAAQIDETRRAQTFAQADAKRGHWLGWSAAAFAMICAIASLAFGYPWVAAVFVSVPVMGVARALVESAKSPTATDIVRAANPQPSVAAPAVAGGDATPTDTGGRGTSQNSP